MNNEPNLTNVPEGKNMRENHMAILEDRLRDEIKTKESEATAFSGNATESGDRAAAGREQEADAMQASINRETNLVGETYDKMTQTVGAIRERAEGYTGPEAESQRAQMNAKLNKAMAKHGLIGVDAQLGEMSASRFAEDDDVRVANGHAGNAQVGFKKAA